MVLLVGNALKKKQGASVEGQAGNSLSPKEEGPRTSRKRARALQALSKKNVERRGFDGTGGTRGIRLEAEG